MDGGVGQERVILVLDPVFSKNLDCLVNIFDDRIQPNDHVIGRLTNTSILVFS